MYAFLTSVGKFWDWLIFIFFGSGWLFQENIPIAHKGLQEHNYFRSEKVIKYKGSYQSAFEALCELKSSQFNTTALHLNKALLLAPLEDSANHNQDRAHRLADQLTHTGDIETGSVPSWSKFYNISLVAGATGMQYPKPQVSKARVQNIIFINGPPPEDAILRGSGLMVFLIAGSITYLSTRQYLVRKGLTMRKAEKTKYHQPPPFQKSAGLAKIPETLSLKFQERNLLLPPEVIQNIWEQLTQFERNQEYLDPELDLTKLAVRFGTNQKYLSHVINQYKKMTFPSYMKTLRVYYAIRRLLEDPKLHRYNLEGLADQFGFKSGRAFSMAFSEITGCPPSKLLEQLRAQQRIKDCLCEDDS